MNTKDLKQKYLDFFESQNHKLISGAKLLPENDPTALFISAGMHPLVPYLLGDNHPSGNRLTSIQKCIRTGDIDEVGDDWHLTFFEMLGNWSLGDYFKKEAVEMSFKFLTKELGISIDRLAVTCFEGDEKNDIPRDTEVAEVWKSLGVSEKRIAFLGRKDNWWGPAGQTGPCGPDTEMFYFAGEGEVPEVFDPSDDNWVEIWNDVFMQYNKTADGKYEPLAQKNVDTGMGLERTAAILSGKQSVYDIEPMSTIVLQVTSLIPDMDISAGMDIAQEVGEDKNRAIRIIADHMRAAVFILAENVEPSNAEQGYVLRRLIRRSVRYAKQLGIQDMFTVRMAEVVIDKMGGFYKELREQRDFIFDQLSKEEEKFAKTLEKGLKQFEKVGQDGRISGEEAFKLFATYGFPYEMTVELARENNLEVDEAAYNKEFSTHQETSRKGADQKFKGGLADSSKETARLHTAAHLMLAALRQVLGDHVLQKGSNITSERLRFDFSHPDKMTDEEKKKVEDLVNEQINQKLPVSIKEMSLQEAKEAGAMGVFEDKYDEKVKVYSMGDFSKEICGGPHADNTGELGQFRIKKESSSSSGVRRIKAILE
jgi:alanyl-tRNA synthetase